jgi:hypothetical protein
LLYAGTEFGMFISFDNGTHWQSFQLNLPNVPVTDIKVHHNDLIVSTQGRAFWIMDNISSLRELSAQMNQSEAHLFKPRDAYRTRTAAANLGPQIDYYLPSSSSPVSVEILDAKGVVVNSYSSETGVPDRPARADAQSDDPDAPSARRFGPPAPRVTKNPGMNRVVWDLKNKDSVTLPPGQYQARVKFGATTQTQAFNVLIDPRVAADGVTAADLQEQYEHNMRLRALVNGVNRLVARVREARNKSTTAADGNGDTSARLKAIATRLLSEPVRYGKPGLQAHITYLASMTANVDQKIGRDAIERYAVLKKEFDAISAQVDQLLGPAR